MVKRCLYGAILSLILIVSIPCVAFADNTNGVDSGVPDQKTEVNVEVLRISANDTTGLHSIILSLIGDYNPIVKDYTYTTTSYGGNVQTNHSIDIQPDWSWIASAFIFVVVLYSFFRILGMLFGNK